MTGPALLLLADGRFPAGGHAHSFGIEAAIGVGDVRDVDDLRSFVLGRLATIGVVEAAFAAATVARLRDDEATVPWAELEIELAARTASPVVRAASRSLGRQVLRAGRRVWPSPVYDALRTGSPAEGPLQPIALGAVAHVAGLSPLEAALCSLHHLVSGTTTAAVRLLGLDPFDVAALVARLGPEMATRADAASTRASHPAAELPADVGLLADILAEHHATWEVRLFAS